MSKGVEQNIELKICRIQTLEAKLNSARDIQDRELEIKILEFIQQHKDSINEYSICKENLRTAYHLVDTGQFFSRFNEILDHQLGLDEHRLIVLYFVDYLMLSMNRESKLYFKTNIFSDLIDFG